MLLTLLSAITNIADKSKAERVLDKYEKLLFKIAFRILRNQKDAEDCVQETNLKIIRNLDKIDESKPKEACNFVATICGRTALKMYDKRKKYTENLCSYDELDEKIEAIGCDPLDILTSNENIDRICESILNLSKTYRDLVQFKATYKCSNKKISEIFDIPVGTVKIQLHRARKNLAEDLTKEGLK